MAAYVIFNYMKIHNEQRILDYRKEAHPTVAKYGGRVVIRPGPLQVEEGPSAEFIIVLEFENLVAANNWYHSAEYQRIKMLRLDAADVQAFIVEGGVS